MRINLSTKLIAMSFALLSSNVYSENFDIEKLQKEISDLKKSHDDRIEKLQKRIKVLEAKQVKANKTQSKLPDVKPNPPQARELLTEKKTISSLLSKLNPKISAALNAGFNHYSLKPSLYRLPGFQLAPESELSPSGFNIYEAEISLQAHIDRYFYGNITLDVHQHGNHHEVDLEEAYARTEALPFGLSAQIGRFFSGIGYLNVEHRHDWDFVDAPLVYRALFNNQLILDGVQFRWQAPTPFLWEFGTEAATGNVFPAENQTRKLNTYTFFSHIGGDIGSSQNWQLGTSYIYATPNEREAILPEFHDHHHSHKGGHHHDHDGYNFTGTSKTIGLDGTWKWSFNHAQELSLQGEIYRRLENGFIYLSKKYNSTLDSHQNGLYIQAIYKFLPQWRIGYRYDYLWSHNRGDSIKTLAKTGLISNYRPNRSTVMLDFSLSQASRIRLQYGYDRSYPKLNHEVMLQFIFLLGGHEADNF